MPQDEATHIPERLVLKCSMFVEMEDGVRVERVEDGSGRSILSWLPDVAKPHEGCNNVMLDRSQMRELAAWLLKELHK